jgi:hypothetical protein
MQFLLLLRNKILFLFILVIGWYKKSLVSEAHLPTASENRHFGNKQILFGGTLLEKKYVMIH